VERKLVLVGFGTLMVVLIVAGILHANTQNAFNGSEIEPSWTAPDFQLTSHSKTPLSLSLFHGKVVLVFFGYTSCPDICPLTVATMRQVFDILGEASEDIRFIFITTDPPRDTSEKLAEYLTPFNPSFVGLTGTREQLWPVWKDYGVTVLDDGVTHSTRIYLIDQKGYLRLTFPYGMSAESIAEDISRVLAAK
jgi:protein SCO1